MGPGQAGNQRIHSCLRLRRSSCPESYRSPFNQKLSLNIAQPARPGSSPESGSFQPGDFRLFTLSLCCVRLQVALFSYPPFLDLREQKVFTSNLNSHYPCSSWDHAFVPCVCVCPDEALTSSSYSVI